MSRIRGKANVDRILAYLDQQQHTANSTEQEAYCAAWILVFATFYRPKEPAFAQALVIYGITSAGIGETSTPTPKPLPFGVYEQTEIDGRNGRQWMQSVRDYLIWRSGGSWRRLHTAAGRNDPEYECYIRAVNFLNRVPQHFPVAPSLTGCVSEGQRFIEQRSTRLRSEQRKLPARKPPASAALPALTKTG